MARWFITVFLMLLPLLLLACGSGNGNGEAVTHRLIPQALEGSHGDKVWFGQLFISLVPKPALVSNGEQWGFRAFAPRGQGSMDIYVDADAISFELKPGVSVKVKGVLHYGADERMTVVASSVERLSCNDTNDCR